jgi:hypothetical protein
MHRTRAVVAVSITHHAPGTSTADERPQTLSRRGKNSRRRQLERVLHTQGEASFAADFDSYVDNLMTRSCHSKPLPCSRGDGECLTLDDARAVLDEGNWQYQLVYADEELNQLTSGHFLWDLTAAMAAMVAADRGAAGQETPYKLGVFGGHDTTVAPLIGVRARPPANYAGLSLSLSPHRPARPLARRWFVPCRGGA